MSSGIPELPDAKKWWGGFTDVTRWVKDAGTWVRLIVISFALFALIMGATALWRIIVPKKTDKPAIGQVTGGTVDASNNKKIKVGLNLF